MDLPTSKEKLIDGCEPESAMRLLELPATTISRCPDGKHCCAHGDVVHACCRCGSVFVATDVGKLITPVMRALFCRLWEIGLKGDAFAAFVSGPEVRAARKLESLGIVKLTDNGAVESPLDGRSDGERWYAEIE